MDEQTFSPGDRVRVRARVGATVVSPSPYLVSILLDHYVHFDGVEPVDWCGVKPIVNVPRGWLVLSDAVSELGRVVT